MGRIQMLPADSITAFEPAVNQGETQYLHMCTGSNIGQQSLSAARKLAVQTAGPVIVAPDLLSVLIERSAAGWCSNNMPQPFFYVFPVPAMHDFVQPAAF